MNQDNTPQTNPEEFHVCEACHGAGWLMQSQDGEPRRLAIERCDLCERFDSDDAAVKHVAGLARENAPLRHACKILAHAVEDYPAGGILRKDLDLAFGVMGSLRAF